MYRYFKDVRTLLRPFDGHYGHWVYFVVIWYIFPRVGILHQEKSGNPAEEERRCRPNNWNCFNRERYRTTMNLKTRRLHWPIGNPLYEGTYVAARMRKKTQRSWVHSPSRETF
jgi:hypothetical protein